MMKRLALICLLLACTIASATSRQKLQGYCQNGGTHDLIGGLLSAKYFMQNFPSCVIAVYDTGTTNLSTIYSDNSGTPLANPFTASSTGLWGFYADNGHYDVRESAGGIPSPFTLSDWTLYNLTTEGICYADQQSGSDIGAKFNACVTALSGAGQIVIPAGSYNYSTTMVKPRAILLTCQGDQATILHYTGTTAALVVGDNTAVGATSAFYGVVDCTFQGSGAGTSGSPATTIGVFLGGDPAAALSPTNYFANGQGFLRVQIWDFGIGVKWGNNAYLNKFDQSAIQDNNTNIYLPSGTTNSGESISFSHSLIDDGVSAVNGSALRQDMAASDLYFIDSSFDSNVAPDIKGTNYRAEFYGVHFEHPTVGEFFSVATGVTKIYGGFMQNGCLSGCASDPDFGTWSGSGGTILIVDGLTLSPAHPMTQAFNFTATGNYAQIDLRNLPCYNGTGNLPLLTNAITLGTGSYIEDCEANSHAGLTTIGNRIAVPSIVLNGGTVLASQTGTGGTIAMQGGPTLTGTTTVDTINGTTFSDGFITWSTAQFNRSGAQIELQFAGAAGSKVGIGAAGSNPITFDANTGNASVASLTTGAITNAKGLQVFSTNTTCTTAASVGAVCTTAAITLPIAYADTNYRLACVGQTPTNVPIVQTDTKSNSTFTITIAALTAAAATFTSYDCWAAHN